MIRRCHMIPPMYNEDFLQDIYYHWKKIHRVIPTSLDVRLYLRKYHNNFSRFSTLREVEIFVPCGSLKEQINAVAAESMDELFLCKNTTCGFDVSGKIINNSNSICAICLDNQANALKVKLDACGCIFHHKCITLSTKYSTQCPLCYHTINNKV